MPGPAETVEGRVQQPAAYANSCEHLADELQRLDLLIRLKLLRQRRYQPVSPLDQFRGLVVTETEVESLLADADALIDDDEFEQSRSEENALVAILAAIEQRIVERRALSQESGTNLSLAQLDTLFQLTPFQQNVLLLALAPQLDRKYEKLYAYLQDDVTRKAPTVDLAMNLFLNSTDQKLEARSAFDPGAALLRFKLLQVPENEAETTPLLSRQLKLDDRIVNFFLDVHRPEARLDRAMRLLQPPKNFAATVCNDNDQQFVRDFIKSDFGGPAGTNLVVYCRGACRAEKEAFAESVAGDLRQRVLVADLAQLTEGPVAFEEALWLAGREALLQPAVLCLENFDVVNAEDLVGQTRLKLIFDVAKACCRQVFLFGRKSWQPRGLLNESIFVDLYFPNPDDSDRKHLWEAITPDQFADDVDFGALASKFHFTRGQIQDAFIAAADLARLRAPGDAKISMDDLEAACRAQSSQKLAALTKHVTPKYTWKDIVLPENVLAQLHEICQCVIHRYRVLGEWGFGRRLSLGKGVNALFAGPSGTGKTMGTEIIANELGMDLYKIDLSGVISKYIGETEKNLDRIFAAAEETSAILFFDEADALFGKRSEVRDSHDRYANIEISYLLQKMEEYEGLAILATNLRQNMDDAFLRRLQFVVEFPFPDEYHRKQIWQVLFPAEAPRDQIEFDFLASQFRFAGGNIKNIVLGAAYLAAADGGRITMNHVMRATSRECHKIGRVFTHDDREKFSEVIQ
jgi:SpoVK/Ycf46/Vps4 family AAA+-type ATPase